MRIVLLSGGSGKRLWPLSNEIRSKIFLKLLRAEDGSLESMMQRICRQLDSAGLLHSSYILTHRSQVEITMSHVGGGIPIIAEPAKKGTFTAVALAAAYLHEQLGVSPDETVCIIPVDAFVDSAFFELFHAIPDILAKSQAELALIGCVPRSPSTQYGYMVPKLATGIMQEAYAPIAQFVEKPSEAHARELIERKALWNCGVFAFSLKFMLSYLDGVKLPASYEALIGSYEQLPERSFDYEVAEHNRHAVLIPYTGAWNDIGSWATLAHYLESPVIGSGNVSDDSINTHLVNELPLPIHVIGVSNLIVAASPDGILVASKDKSNEIKERLPSGKQRQMFEEKRWGAYRVLDHTKTEHSCETRTSKVEVAAGNHTSYHVHRKKREVWTIIAGTAEFVLDGVVFPVQAGDVLQITPGLNHGIRAITALTCIEVQIGEQLLDEDIERLSYSWNV